MAMNGGGVNATVQREKLFKNAVWWLLNLPPVPAFMNMSVDVAGVPVEMKVGQEVTLTATIQHTGEIPATGVILAVALPPNVTLVSATAENGDTIAEEQNVICLLPNLARVDNTTVVIVVRANALGPVEIDFTVSENQAEAIRDDNAFIATFEIVK
jgi:uncharacterized repeat protein (TIGR01451 family)